MLTQPRFVVNLDNDMLDFLAGYDKRLPYYGLQASWISLIDIKSILRVFHREIYTSQHVEVSEGSIY